MEREVHFENGMSRGHYQRESISRSAKPISPCPSPGSCGPRAAPGFFPMTAVCTFSSTSVHLSSALYRRFSRTCLIEGCGSVQFSTTWGTEKTRY